MLGYSFWVRLVLPRICLLQGFEIFCGISQDCLRGPSFRRFFRANFDVNQRQRTLNSCQPTTRSDSALGEKQEKTLKNIHKKSRQNTANRFWFPMEFPFVLTQDCARKTYSTLQTSRSWLTYLIAMRLKQFRVPNRAQNKFSSENELTNSFLGWTALSCKWSGLSKSPWSIIPGQDNLLLQFSMNTITNQPITRPKLLPLKTNARVNPFCLSQQSKWCDLDADKRPYSSNKWTLLNSHWWKSFRSESDLSFIKIYICLCFATSWWEAL